MTRLLWPVMKQLIRVCCIVYGQRQSGFFHSQGSGTNSRRHAFFEGNQCELNLLTQQSLCETFSDQKGLVNFNPALPI